MSRLLVALIVLLGLAGCIGGQQMDDAGDGVETKVFAREVPGYGNCTFVWAEDYEGDAGGLALVGCSDG